MKAKTIKRLPEVKTLYEMLPKGAEGGKEFARIVDLLLFHEARKAGEKITIFNDASGDYFGLDSFEGDSFRKSGTTGYQYKFYPSPLKSNHRTEILKSLKNTAENRKELKLKKWVLVTPQDLIESATRKDGGDVTWFEGLRKNMGLKFELEHWGHKKILSLFLETPSLCLFYYPDLTPDGATRKKTIQDIRQRYNDNLNTLYRRIEFVGMSVYKQEATKGIPMEQIYIPLTAVPAATDESDSNVPRTNPLTFLKPGARHVVLGDPGSGKSTMLRFLALAGRSRQLQERYKSGPDSRLPVLITLRRYADELKTRKNLALIDYIQENIQGDFNLKSADQDFFEYYLESGQAILLFDGIDELPNPQFKKWVRDSIRTLITTYPGNTTIVTSRIVGYEGPFRFDDKEFSHQRLTWLKLPEIEQFVKDWYRARIENKREREANENDLIRILRDEDHIAIRELAQNPLLLTIIALVHRIDAVLPDERVVLYQKCTETLLNTWHTWKFRSAEIKNRGKVERRNRRRMETIAHWMHCRSVSAGKHQRAVVPYSELKKFLADHIEEVEKYRDRGSEPEDLAEDFLEFVKKRAGLLIEIGDNQGSFVHLTFQEYLTSSHIITTGEKEGASGVWEKIKEHCTEARWNEVIRLLIAGLKSDESQEFLIEEILSEKGEKLHEMRSRLLGGLLLDGIEPAEARRVEILEHLLYSGSKTDDTEQLRPIMSILRTWFAKDLENEEATCSAFKSQWKIIGDYKQKQALALIAIGLNWPFTKFLELTGDHYPGKGRDKALFGLLFHELSYRENYGLIKKDIEYFWNIQNAMSHRSAYNNFVAVAWQAVNSSLEPNIVAKRAFEEQMVELFPGVLSGPYFEYNKNGLIISDESSSFISKWALDRAQDRALDRTLDRALDRDRDRVLEWDRALTRARDRVMARTLERNLDRNLDRDREQEERDLALNQARDRKGDFWQTVLTSPPLFDPILDLLCDTFVLNPKAQWREALRVGFLPSIPKRITIYNEALWKQVEKAFEKGKAGETEIYFAAWQLLFDAWLYIFGYYKKPDESKFKGIAVLTREMDKPPLRIAHCIRDLAYGDESRTDDLVSMVKSDDPQYRAIFETTLWRPTPEEEIRERKKRK